MQPVREMDPAPADPVDELGDAVLDLVHAVTHAARNPGHALPVLELARLLVDGERRLGELAAERGVCQSVVSRQAGELEARGLIVRRPDPADRRAGLISLTPAGRDHLETVMHARRVRFRNALAPVPAQDVQAAVRVLRALSDELDRRTPTTSEGQS